MGMAYVGENKLRHKLQGLIPTNLDPSNDYRMDTKSKNNLNANKI